MHGTEIYCTQHQFDFSQISMEKPIFHKKDALHFYLKTAAKFRHVAVLAISCGYFVYFQFGCQISLPFWKPHILRIIFTTFYKVHIQFRSIFSTSRVCCLQMAALSPNTSENYILKNSSLWTVEYLFGKQQFWNPLHILSPRYFDFSHFLLITSQKKGSN